MSAARLRTEPYRIAMTIETARIRSEPHFEIGSIISQDAAELVDRWVSRALVEQPTAARVYLDVLRNELREFLEAMGRGLLQSGERHPGQHRAQASDHGEQRWDSGWSLTELVRDYQILQLVILDHLSSRLDRPIEYREAMAVGVFINDAIGSSIAAYVASREDSQREIERAAVEALREAQTRKDDFLALVVHELRNPVAPIMTAATTLGMMLQEADEQVRNPVRILRRQSRQLARLLDDLSDLTRITQGRLTLRRAVVDVAGVVEQATQTCEALMAERRHRLETHLEDPPLVVEGDADRLVQVVVNLLNNAAKYTPPDGQVTIIAQRRDDRVELIVRDTGRGIPPEMLTQVFDMYTRVSAPPEPSTEGLGIGLALVKELVALHDGLVKAASDGPGQGAEFVVSLPAYHGSASVTRSTPEARPLRP